MWAILSQAFHPSQKDLHKRKTACNKNRPVYAERWLIDKELRRTVWSVGTNLRKQVGADWTLPSCPMGYHIHVTWPSSRF